MKANNPNAIHLTKREIKEKFFDNPQSGKPTIVRSAQSRQTLKSNIEKILPKDEFKLKEPCKDLTRKE